MSVSMLPPSLSVIADLFLVLGGSAFSESKEVDINEPVDIQAGDYSYDADSDLESDDGYDDDARGRYGNRQWRFR